MIHSSESTHKNHCILGRVTGVFTEVSLVCTTMLHHCIVGVQKGWQMWRIINTYVVVSSPLTGYSHAFYLGAFVVHMTPLQSLRWFMYATYSKQYCLLVLPQIRTKLYRCASFMWQNKWQIVGTSKKIYGPTYIAYGCVTVITTKNNKTAAFESI